MPLLTQKRRRTYRDAGLEPASLLTKWGPRIIRERTILVQLFIALLAVAAMVLAVEGWRSIFPYRVDSRVDRDVVARVSFRRINLSATEKAKTEAAESVPPIFTHDPSKLARLPARLRSHLSAVAAAERLQDLDPDIREAFGLTTPPVKAESSQPSSGGSSRAQFQTLRAVIAGEDGSAGDRIDDVVREFQQFIAPLRKYGRANPAELERFRLSSTDPVTIITPGGGTRLQVYRSDIVLKEALGESGRLGKQWNRESELFRIRGLLKNWLLSEAPATTLSYDEQATQQARREAVNNVETVYDVFNKGQTLVPAGETIEQEMLAVLRSEYEAYEQQIPPSQRMGRLGTVTLLMFMLAVLMGYYLVRNEPRLVRSPVRLSIYLGTIIAAILIGRQLVTGAWRAEIIPLLVTVMVFAVAYDQRLALMTALTLSLILALSTTADLTHFVVLLTVTSAVVVPLAEVPSRSALIKVGFWSAGVYFVISWSTAVVWNQAIASNWADPQVLLTSLRGAGCCLVAGYLVAGSLPFVESTFDVVTDISLLEMSDVSHPLLQELARRAPGTYNHSITIATIGEAAADAIGANGLLVRIGAYFHDIGKMLKPEYFIENMTEGTESRHKKLAPAMSTLIIIGHVKDGVDLARQHNLPQSIIDFVEQHHGTTLVEYFYHEAAKQVETQPDHKTDAEEASFRYPGPKPQTKEAGVLMLADAVEGASRALSEPTPKRIESLVKSISMKRLLDDQLDESSLTLSEIRVIEESLIKSLIAIYHGRIKYPEQRTA